jgi:uncharacterized protein YhjY with autotransporter beta-barrel domain
VAIKSIRKRLFLSPALVTGMTLFSGTAWADCVADTTGQTVSCTSSSTGYSTSAPGVAVTVTNGASVTGSGLQAVGANSSVDTLGTINTGSGTTAVSLGGNGTVTEEAAASGAITGNILFGAATGAQVNTVNNLSTTNGIAGLITSVGNTTINNSGLVSGGIVETTASGADTVNIINSTGATITGAITTSDTTNLMNTGTITGTTTTTAPLTITNNVGGVITGSITGTTPAVGSGFLSVLNNGAITGDIIETAGSTAGSVTVTNNSGATLTGNITTADATNFTNAGTYAGIITNTSIVPGSVNNSGTMTLSGIMTGTLTNSGTLTVGTTASPAAPALLTINGSYSQTGVLNVPMLSSAVAGTGYGQIHTTGTAVLAGTINVTPVQGFYPTGSTYNIVLADQGITNNGVTVNGVTTVSPFLTFTSNGVVTVSGAQQALQIAATRTATYISVLAPTATANQLAVAGGAQTAASGGFQNLVNTANVAPTGDAAVLVGGVDFMTVAQAQTFFDQVSPQGYGAYVTALQDQGNLFSRQINMRLDTLGITKDATPGLWLTPYFQRGKAGGNTYGSGETIFGIQGGVDVGNEFAHGGMSVGYSKANVDYNVGNLTGSDSSLQVGAYGGITLKRFNADLQIDYIHGSVSASKSIALGATSRTATADTSANLFKAVATLGYNFGGESNRIQPFVGFDFNKGKINGFTEGGANSADLTVDGLNADRQDVLVGFDYARMTGSVRPYLHLAYRYNLLNPNTQITAMFNADPTTSFTVTDLVPSRSEEDANAGVRFQADDWGSYLFVGYQGTIRSGLTSHGVNAGVLVAF